MPQAVPLSEAKLPLTCPSQIANCGRQDDNPFIAIKYRTINFTSILVAVPNFCYTFRDDMLLSALLLALYTLGVDAALRRFNFTLHSALRSPGSISQSACATFLVHC
jgi:hypothetical protein